MKSGKARVAVIGTGWWATFAHIPGLQAHEGADLVALCDADPVRLNRAADEYQIDSRYDDVHGMLEAEQLDGVVVATTPATHYDVAKSCLERGLHVMVEKPMVSEEFPGARVAPDRGAAKSRGDRWLPLAFHGTHSPS